MPLATIKVGSETIMMTDEETFENLKTYIEQSKRFFSSEGNRSNLRAATHLILDFYKSLLSYVCMKIGKKHCESQSIPNKFLLIRTQIPEFEEKEDLVKKIESFRNAISHNDSWFPKKGELRELIGQAEDFLQFSKSQVKIFRERGERDRNLKDEVRDEIYNLGFFISLNQGVGNSKELEYFISKREKYEEMDLEKLRDKNLQSMKGLLEIDIRKLKSMYDRAWEICPRCGGKIVEKRYSKTHYRGPYDDPEPLAVTYYETVECEKCGLKLVNEQETIDI